MRNIVVACTTHHEKNSRLRALFGNSKVKISLLSDGTLVSDRKDPLAGTNDGINLNGAKFQYFFPEERFFVVVSFVDAYHGTVILDILCNHNRMV